MNAPSFQNPTRTLAPLLLLLLLPLAVTQAEPEGCETLNREASCARRPPAPEPDFKAWQAELEASGAPDRFFEADPGAGPGERAAFPVRLFAALQAFKKRYSCEPAYSIEPRRLVYDNVPIESAHSREFQDHSLRTRRAELETKRRSLLRRLHEENSKGTRLTHCSREPHPEVGTPIAVLSPPCIMAFTQLLPDNEYRVEKFLGEIMNSKEFTEGLHCLASKEESLERVTIVASSSALNNRSPEFCKKDFLGLSKARAERVKEVLLPLILKGRENQVEVRLHYQGSNHDGTSGPCPYRKTSGDQEELIPGFLTDPLTRNELENAKSLLIRFEFKGRDQALQDQKPTLTHTLHCRSVALSCRD